VVESGTGRREKETRPRHPGPRKALNDEQRSRLMESLEKVKLERDQVPFDPDPMLSGEQRYVIDLALQGKSFFFTGAAGEHRNSS
jgi:hypothetical protein